MSAQRFLLDQYGNTIRSVSYDPRSEEDGYTFRSEQDVDAILDANARDAGEDQRGRTFRHVARIPLEIINRATREGWLHDKARWRKLLNDPDFKRFRTGGGRI